MSGHSKWSQIKRQKGVTDAKRGQLFTKIGREVTVAAKRGGPDPNDNASLRLAIAKARAANMPKVNVERAIQRAAGGSGGADWSEVRYEGYGPGGVALLIETLTDNRNRTVGDVRSRLSKAGGAMGEAGCVAWNFTQQGVITIDVSDPTSADEIALVAIDAGAEDVEVEEGLIEIVTSPAELERVREAMAGAGVEAATAEVAWRPGATIALDEKKARVLLKLIDALEELDDVQHVATNAEFPDSVFVEA